MEGEVLTIYDKIRDEQKKSHDELMGTRSNPIPTRQSDNPQVYQLLQMILDKLHAIDGYLRGAGSSGAWYNSTANDVKPKKELENK